MIKAVEDFDGFADVANTTSPGVVRGGAVAWPAVNKWSLNFLGDVLGDELVPLNNAGPARPPAIPLSHMAAAAVDHDHDQSIYTGWVNLRGSARARTLLRDIRTPAISDPPVVVQEINLWACRAGNHTPLHFDPKSNVYVQVSGRKRFLLVPPDAADLTPSSSPGGSQWTFGDLSSPNGFSLVVDLAAGDCLYLPPFWYHDVYAHSPSVSVNFFWRPRLGQVPSAGLTRLVKRVLERGEAGDLRFIDATASQIGERLWREGDERLARALTLVVGAPSR